MVKQLQIVPRQCTGCRQCELACAWVRTGTFQPTRSLIRVHVFDEEASYAPYACVQCAEAWCMNACPTNAIFTDPTTGAKRIDAGACVGCHLCTLVCPYGTVFTLPQSGTAAKCDLCGGRPACVASCPTDAIQYTETDGTGSWFDEWSRQVQECRLAMQPKSVDS